MKMRFRIGAIGALMFAAMLAAASVSAAEKSTGTAAPPAVANTPSRSSGAATVPKWSTHEIVLTATGTYTSPYVSVDLLGVFSGPSGTSVIVNGFWDGGQTFRIRFTPTVEGTWTYTTVSDDPGLDDRGGLIQCVAPEAGRRGFVRQVPGTGETWKSDDGTAVSTEATALGARAHVGRCGGDGDPCEDAIGPGHDNIDVALLQAADARVKAAAGAGPVEVCLFDPSDSGTIGEARMYRYIEYMTARYGAYPQVVWGLHPGAASTSAPDGDGPTGFWQTARSLVASTDPYFLNGALARVLRETCPAAPLRRP